MPAARCSGGYMSPPAVRTSVSVPSAAPSSTKPPIASGASTSRVPIPVTIRPQVATTNPTASGGIRPNRSIPRPAW